MFRKVLLWLGAAAVAVVAILAIAISVRWDRRFKHRIHARGVP